ncbi:unnamed protein product, partial [Medioppia subpectinata]
EDNTRHETQDKGLNTREVIESDIESNDGIDCDINVESDNETIDGTVDESVVTNQTQDMRINGLNSSQTEELSQRHDNSINKTPDKGFCVEENTESDIESNDGIDCDINCDSDNETIVGSVDQNEDMNDRQDLNRNEEKSESNLNERGIQLNVKFKNNCETNSESIGSNERDNSSGDEDMDSQQNNNISEIKKQLSIRRYFCPQENCFRHYSWKKGLNYHLKNGTHECRDKTYICGINACVYKTSSKHELQKHISSEHKFISETIRPFVCNFIGCDNKYSHKTGLIRHKLKHSGQTYRCDVEECEAIFYAKEYSNRHKRIKHTSKTSLSGSDCNESETQVKIKKDNNCETNAKIKLKSNTSEAKDSETEQYNNGSSDEEMDSNSDSDYTQRQTKRTKYDTKTDGQFVCDINGCGKRYKRKVYLNEHKRIHLGHKYQCDVEECEAIFVSKKYLRTHKRNIHTNTERRFVCDFIGCDKKYYTIRDLSRHKGIHLGHTYQCEECGKCVRTTESLIKHKRIHLGETYRCSEVDCRATFTTEVYLKKHIIIRHGSKYRCDHKGCDYKTGCLSYLKSHQISHSNERQFKCSINGCDKTFKTETSFNKHQLRTHSDFFADIPWIECSHTGCQYRSKIKPDITVHMKTHSKPYRCDECGKSFGSTDCLKRHKRTHDKSSQIPCEWPECERRFTNNNVMKAHMNSHTCETTYRCQWPGCDNTYNHRNGLETHVRRVHNGLLDLKCHWPECEYSTTNPIRLHNHIDRQHKGLQDYRVKSRLNLPGTDIYNGVQIRYQRSLHDFMESYTYPFTYLISANNNNSSKPYMTMYRYIETVKPRNRADWYINTFSGEMYRGNEHNDAYTCFVYFMLITQKQCNRRYECQIPAFLGYIPDHLVNQLEGIVAYTLYPILFPKGHMLWFNIDGQPRYCFTPFYGILSQQILNHVFIKHKYDTIL